MTMVGRYLDDTKDGLKEIELTGDEVFDRGR